MCVTIVWPRCYAGDQGLTRVYFSPFRTRSLPEKKIRDSLAKTCDNKHTTSLTWGDFFYLRCRPSFVWENMYVWGCRQNAVLREKVVMTPSSVVAWNADAQSMERQTRMMRKSLMMRDFAKVWRQWKWRKVSKKFPRLKHEMLMRQWSIL